MSREAWGVGREVGPERFARKGRALFVFDFVKPDKGFKDLAAWRNAMTLIDGIYQATRGFPRTERSLTDQLRRAAVSIATNIAAGYERQHRRERLQFFCVARGSLGEAETILLIAEGQGFVSQDAGSLLRRQVVEVRRPLQGLIGFTKRSRTR